MAPKDLEIGGIKITDNYGLQILNEKNKPIPAPSNAYTEILTISLIYGLQKAARKSGPVVIDNPLQHLSKMNKIPVMKFLRKMGEQVVILMHDGEYDRDELDEAIGKNIGAEYKILQNHSLDSSWLEER